MPQLNVAIVGGGPAGLTLANLLLSSNSKASHSKLINVTVFERDPSSSSRIMKGGSLDLHAETGLAALEAAGLRPAFDARARYDPRSSEFTISDRHGKPALRLGSGQETNLNARPEIDREELRTLLVDALPEGTIRWGAHVSSVSPDGAFIFGATTGLDDEPTKGKYDLVVGADGAWSKVRAHITDKLAVYSGISGFELHIADPDNAHPEIAETVGQGLYILVGGERTLIGQRLGNGGIMLYAFARTETANDPQELINACGGDLKKVQEALSKRYEDAGWAPEICQWIVSANPSTIRGWPLYEFPLPDGHVYAHRPGWTVIGDAAHAMTPFAGEGVNAAMRDALELATRLREAADAEGAGDLDRLVRDYEEEMFGRSRKVMTDTFQNKETMLARDAPLKSFGEDAESGDEWKAHFNMRDLERQPPS